jgi:hypothetical protein
MSTVPSSAATSKRHSSGGPRPLQLVDAPGYNSTTRPLSVSSLPSFRTAEPSPPLSITNHIKRHHPQRQSSISYYSRDCERTSSPFAPRHALSRSMSLGLSSPKIGGVGGDIRSTGSASNGTEVMERPPLTLTEKSVYGLGSRTWLLTARYNQACRSLAVHCSKGGEMLRPSFSACYA